MSRRPKRPPSGKNDNLEGQYANYFKVGHNAYEFVIDFGQYYPENDKAELYTRIITGPAYARDLLEILKDSIIQHEESFGNKDKS
jgi:hypothetical protein